MQKHASHKDTAYFIRQCADLLEGGLTLIQVCTVLYEQTTKRSLKRMISTIREELQKGQSFTAALSHQNTFFTSVQLNMVKGGEASGKLPEIISHMATAAENELEVKSKIYSALAYPAIVCFLGTLSILVLVLYVMPRFVPIFTEFEQQLPLPTRLVLAVSAGIQSYWYLILFLIIGLTISIKNKGFTAQGNRLFDHIKHSLPLYGNLLKKMEIQRFAQNLGLLLSSGVPIIEAMEITLHGIHNSVLQQKLFPAIENLNKGLSLAAALEQTGCFSPLFINLLAVGEKGGILERALEKIASTYEKDIMKALKLATAILEPALLIIIGCLVGLIVLAMMLPLFTLNAAIQ